MSFAVHLCQGWQRIGCLDGGDAFAFTAVERWRTSGEWSLTFPDAAPTWSSYLDDDGVTVLYGPRDVDTVRLVEDRSVRFGGWVGEISSGSGGATRDYTSGGVRWTLGGPDLWAVLAARVAFPDPAVASGWGDAYDVRSGAASTVLAGYLTDNVGSGALADRQVSGFSVADSGVGLAGEWSARFQRLDELAQRVCTDGQVSIRLTVNLLGQIEATIGVPPDLSAVHVLSDQGDLVSVTSRYIPAKSTYVLAGGQGTGVARVFRSADDGATGGDRLERFSDQASLTQAAELQASADATLALDAGTWSIIAEVADATVEQVGFGRSVHVGSLVSVQSQGRRFTVPVTSIEWSVSAERQVCRPRLGEAIPDSFTGLLRDVAGLADRFDRNVA